MADWTYYPRFMTYGYTYTVGAKIKKGPGGKRKVKIKVPSRYI